MAQFTAGKLGTFEVDTDRGYIWQKSRAAPFSPRQAHQIYRAAEKAFPDALAAEWQIVEEPRD